MKFKKRTIENRNNRIRIIITETQFKKLTERLICEGLYSNN
jgi:hypothetical protein